MKKIIKVAFAAIFATIAGYDVYASQTEDPMSDLMQANEKALTDGESSEQGTLYGTPDGTRYCCCSGTRTCGASRCSNC